MEFDEPPAVWLQNYLCEPYQVTREPGTYCRQCGHDGQPWPDDGLYTPERYRGRPCCPKGSCNCADHMTNSSVVRGEES